MAEEIKDETTKNVDTKDKETSQIDKGEFEKAQKSAKALDGLLKDHGFDSLEDLTDMLKDGKDIKGKLGGLNLDEVLQDANTLKSYQEYWAAEEDKKKGDDEDEDDAVAKLQKEVDALKSGKTDEERRTKALQDTERIIEEFNTEVNSLVEKDEGIPETYRPFVTEFLGVNNPANDIDISDSKAVRTMAKDGAKKFTDFIKKVKEDGAQEYRAGKLEIPPISPTEESVATQLEEKPVKNLKEARKTAIEIMTKKLFGGKSG